MGDSFEVESTGMMLCRHTQPGESGCHSTNMLTGWSLPGSVLNVSFPGYRMMLGCIYGRYHVHARTIGRRSMGRTLSLEFLEDWPCYRLCLFWTSVRCGTFSITTVGCISLALLNDACIMHIA
jgi:hypothetical protein